MIRTRRRQEVLLAEYQAAQLSAQHHDRLVWTVTSIVWGGSLILLGIIMKNPMTGLSGIVSVFLCVIGLILTVFVWSAQRQFRRLRNQKYARCKEIESVLGMKHHQAIKWKEGSQTKAYSLIMVLFIVAWLLVAISVFPNCLTEIRQQENMTISGPAEIT